MHTLEVLTLLSDFNQEFNVDFSSFFEVCNYLQTLNIDFVHGRGKRKSKEQKYYELCAEYLEKYQILEKSKSLNLNIKNVVADAGYESITNYEYLKENEYTSYIKSIYFEKSKTRKFKNDLNKVENLIYIPKENGLFRKDGLELEFLYLSKNGKKQYFFNPETQKKT